MFNKQHAKIILWYEEKIIKIKTPLLKSSLVDPLFIELNW